MPGADSESIDEGDLDEAGVLGIERVAIVGAGFMGTGIAESVAIAGVPVTIRDVDDDSLARARTRIADSFGRAVAAGKLDSDTRKQAEGRIVTTTSLEQAVEQADLVIEAVPEDLELKCAVIAEIDERAGDGTVLASNTSSIPIAQLAAECERPEWMIGLHFFAPVPVMGLVEVVRALDTDEQVVAAVRKFAISIGKRPIETRDRSGFIVNMLLVPYLMAAVRMYEEGFATREDIDAGMRLGCGHPMGPLRLCDLIGLDVLYAVCNSLFEEFKRDEYAPPPLLKRMLAAGRLGRKSGRGFYRYEPDHEP